MKQSKKLLFVATSKLLKIYRKHHLRLKQVDHMCYVLFFIIGLQTVAYSILWDMKFLARFEFLYVFSQVYVSCQSYI